MCYFFVLSKNIILCKLIYANNNMYENFDTMYVQTFYEKNLLYASLSFKT
jgi:hypothetical protein